MVFLASTVYKVHQATPLGPLQIAIVAIAALCFVAAIATGGLMSAEKTLPAIVHRVHQMIPYLVLLSTSGTLYWILARRGALLGA